MGGVRANLHKCPVFKNNFISGDRLRWLVRWVHLVDDHSLPSRPLHWSLYFHLPCQQVGRRRIHSNIKKIARFRLKQINLQEQFIMAYGGLRGGVGFSLVKMVNM